MPGRSDGAQKLAWPFIIDLKISDTSTFSYTQIWGGFLGVSMFLYKEISRLLKIPPQRLKYLRNAGHTERTKHKAIFVADILVYSPPEDQESSICRTDT